MLLRQVGLLILLLIAVSLPGRSQEDFASAENSCLDFYEVEQVYYNPPSYFEKKLGDFTDWCKRNNVADRLDVGVTLGSMGIGIEAKTPVTRWADLRVGVDWLPGFTVPMHFGLNTYSDGMPTGSFKKVQQMLYEMTGIEMDDVVDMNGHASMVNFKLMVDVFPFQNNRHWHFTAGFFAGTSQVGHAYNFEDEKPTLVGLNIYNRAYDYFTNVEDIFNVPLGGGAYMDPEMVEKLQDKFLKYGHMGVHIGDFKDGTPYIMEPAPDGSVSAKAYVNHFKPFIGAGYSTDLDPLGKWHLSVNAGVIFWGGAPDVINRDWQTGRDINFTKELVNIRGKVGRYMDIIKSFPVYPLLEVSFSYTI